jgi:sterol desaturase/sphingolipid hydroxylase (fatty acid hydroxylase superfamily)
MEEYGKILVIAMPAFLLLIVIEKLYGHFKNNDTVPVIDAISSLYSGVTNAVKDVLGVSLTLISYDYLVTHLAFYTIQSSWLIIATAFIVIDFYGYWTHRWAHQINFFWNKHAIHHSSEEFNLPCALRQSVSSFVNIFTFLLIPAALVGVPSRVITIVLPLHLFLQFWYHTKHIKRMGFLEHIIVTPAHHRVHHAINPLYMDKNHGQIFIFWDKLFGTFQEERDSEPPVFGITRPAHTWNPIVINFQHLFLLIKDAWRAENWSDKFTIWFRPTGWRPAGFEEKYPVHKITDIHYFEKYNPQLSKSLFNWSVFQFFVLLLFTFYLFNHIAQIGLTGIYMYGLFIFTQVYCTTELMNKNKWSILYTVLSSLYGLGLFVFDSNWFGLANLHQFLPYLISFYLIGQAFVAYALIDKK